MTRTIAFDAEWDEEAKVWWATCTGPEGIVTEAATIDALRDRLKVIVPDYLEAVGGSKTEVEIDLTVRITDRVAAE